MIKNRERSPCAMGTEDASSQDGNRHIVRLSPEVSSQIAAGEVIQRPASVVKELLENSIDAGARRIQIDIEDGGASLIRVSDDGCGMSSADAKMALMRFCTSKVRGLEDLFSIKSLGFRGEALPSISQCSKMTIETNLQENLLGTYISVSGGTITEISEKGLPPGTTVTVKDLFYNTPARLKFMKSKAREEDVILDTVLRLTLSFPEIRFIVRSKGKVVLSSSGNGLLGVITDIYGPTVGESIVPCAFQAEDGSIQVKGFLGLPSLYRRQRDRLFLSCNGRPIRNIALTWSVESAYLGLLPPKTYPFCVLDIKVPPSSVDVNVHPQKTEVKFREEEKVKMAVTSSVRMALAQKGLRVDEVHENAGRSGTQGSRDLISEVDGGSFRTPSGSAIIGESNARVYGEIPEERLPMEPPQESDWEYLGPFHDTYLIVKTQASIMIMDKHALAESLAYEELLSGQSGSQDLLMPHIMTLDPKEAAFFRENEELFSKMGFGVRAIGERAVLVSRVPLIRGQALPPESLSQIMSELSSKILNPKDFHGAERHLLHGYLAVASCHGSIRSGQPLSRKEAEDLIRQYMAGKAQRTCPHGRPCILEIPLSEITRFFGR